MTSALEFLVSNKSQTRITAWPYKEFSWTLRTCDPKGPPTRLARDQFPTGGQHGKIFCCAKKWLRECVCVCVWLCGCVCGCVGACVCVCVYLLKRSKTCTRFCVVYMMILLTALLSAYLHRWDPIYFDMMHLFEMQGTASLSAYLHRWDPILWHDASFFKCSGARPPVMTLPNKASHWRGSEVWSTSCTCNINMDMVIKLCHYVWLVLLGFLVSSCCFKLKRNIFFHDFGAWCLSFCLSV